jgi:MFS family permease
MPQAGQARKGRMTEAPNRPRGWTAIVPVAAGNFLEMYDFMVFGYYARAIGQAFFPTHNAAAGLMLALTTYGAGFLMRPIGALVLGAFIDRRGRRAGLLLSLGLMALGTLSMVVTPGYARIGLAAPLLVLMGRLVQGFSAGAELGGVSVYLAEIAPEGRRGFYVAWQSASQQVAVITAAAMGVILNHMLSPAEMNAFGWRIPFAFGCLLAPVLLVLRGTLAETAAFAGQPHAPQLTEVLRTLAANARRVLLGVMLVTATTVAFYLITAYTPTFGAEVLKLSSQDAFTVTLAVGISNLVLLPLAGALSDRIGRRPLLIACTTLMIVTAYPSMRWLAAAPSFGRLLAAALWLAALYASYNGAMVAFLTEAMAPKVRASGFSLAYSLATALFGGFTPAISQGLIQMTGDKAIPGVWLAFAAGLGLIAAWLAKPAAGFAPAGQALRLAPSNPRRP